MGYKYQYTEGQRKLIEYAFESFAGDHPTKDEWFPTAYMIVDAETTGVDPTRDLVVSAAYWLQQDGPWYQPSWGESDNFLHRFLSEDKDLMPRGMGEEVIFDWNAALSMYEDDEFSHSVIQAAVQNADLLSSKIHSYPKAADLEAHGDPPDFALDTVLSAVVSANEAGVPLVIHGGHHNVVQFLLNTEARVNAHPEDINKQNLAYRASDMLLDTGALAKALVMLESDISRWTDSHVTIRDRSGDLILSVANLLNPHAVVDEGLTFTRWCTALHQVHAPGVYWSSDACMKKWLIGTDHQSPIEAELLWKSASDVGVVRALIEEWRSALG